MKALKLFLKDYGAEILLCTAGFLLVFLLLWFRIGSLTFGNAAEIEVTSRAAGSSLQAIIENPLNAPYKLTQRAVMFAGYNGVTSMRLVTTVWAVLAMVLFYLVARQWHSTRIAGLATWLFITSSWFLHTARLATPEVMWLVGLLGLVVVFTPRSMREFRSVTLTVYAVLLASVLYIPGMVWLVLVSLVIQRRNLAHAWDAARPIGLKILGIFSGLIIVTPLIFGLIRSPGLIAEWMGIGPDFGNIAEAATRLASIPLNLFLIGPDDPVRWLGQLPLLSAFEILMFAVGVYFYVSHRSASRARFILVLSALACLIIGFGGLVSLSLIVPAVYLFVATGVAYMLEEWLIVFPNNPLARLFGISLIVIAVLLTSIYQTRSYFVAWRYSPETIQVFDQKM